jgi:hypothetical protein
MEQPSSSSSSKVAPFADSLAAESEGRLAKQLPPPLPLPSSSSGNSTGPSPSPPQPLLVCEFFRCNLCIFYSMQNSAL